jgi:glutathione S-transferase
MFELLTERLRLRQLTADDHDFVAGLLADREVMRHYPRPLSRDESLAWIDRQLSKVNASLKAMSQGLGEKPFCAGIYLSMADIAVGCALGYLDFRFPDIDWRGSYPNLAKLQDKLIQRASFAESVPA